MSMSNASQTRDDIEKPFINTISEALLYILFVLLHFGHCIDALEMFLFFEPSNYSTRFQKGGYKVERQGIGYGGVDGA